ncbi:MULTISPECIES: transglutaminase-like cysteine peptidase [Bosea]|jgi:predicted transglutaminase-like cysteine proteinase|uniref:Transglutaminase-like cysteine peptidase n=1 Tax=Bosea rubneri TaxID=3075434 RepID=A0ABU3SAW2_9HYPH|nr:MULTISPECIES: transglutaminase-like cysteine peptidase [unclassified Bosea (in: a-proteobacteria)]MDU0341923.1 transglutaminase-like cysteine peptidase [Bosea sp. ZW T0_25]HEV7338978.1 transglutaminase-like cysteine peptidase [Bosea sp. (in: a-proteobacteria)]
MLSKVRGYRSCLIAAAIGLAATAAQAQSQSAGLPVASAPIIANGDARAPYAWTDFCKRTPSECAVNTQEDDTVELTPKLWKTIVATNLKANREIEAVTDQDHWGVVDRWDIPTDGKGDCEDYVLLKRKRLAEAGVPRRAMRVTVVIDEDNAGHAVLMIRTDRGDLILDNKRNAILPWSQTGYTYVKRESQARVGWTSLGGLSTPTVASLR